MEGAVGRLLLARGWHLGMAESVTGGLVAARVVGVPGASEWFRGAVVADDAGVKQSVLGVGEGPVVSRDAAAAMAEGARRVLGAEVGLATTGVAGPSEQEGRRSAPLSWASLSRGRRPMPSSFACLAIGSVSDSLRPSGPERPAAPALRNR